MENPNLRSSAVQDFRRARSKALLQQVIARLTGKSIELLPYEDVRRKLKAGGKKNKKLKEIPIDAIVGSVGRYKDFTRSFLPRTNSDEDRWVQVKGAVTNMTGLPPIEVYQIDQAYFVLDGNHRVSIARDLGADHIQAYVTEICTDVPLTPDVQPDDLIIKAEYAEFLERTNLAKLRPQANLDMSIPGKYPILEEHISVHRYFMGIDQDRPVPYQEAVTHWYDEVYKPVVRAIRERGVLRDFPERTETDLYLWLSEHRAELQEALGWEIQPHDAADDLAARFSSAPRRIIARIGDWLLDTVGLDDLAPGPPTGAWRASVSSQDCLFDDILISIEDIREDHRVIEQAITLARCMHSRLYGLHVVSSKIQRYSKKIKAMEEKFEQRCQDAGVSGNLVVEVGKTARKVCERARWTDLVIMPMNHPPSPSPLAHLGSGLSTIIRRCPRPLLLVPGQPSPLQRILLAYDGTSKAREALFIATYLVKEYDSHLMVLSVNENGKTASQALEDARQYLENHEIDALYLEKRGVVAQTIIRTVKNQRCDLILIGGYSFNPLLEIVLGSTVDKVLCTSQVPVLICR
ncbi:MAG TPA: universal stress protein [Chloroflexi bacterium]|nr:universal stress protein [Chloroflexota bacterium]